jgi:hypothetical protein
MCIELNSDLSTCAGQNWLDIGSLPWLYLEGPVIRSGTWLVAWAMDLDMVSGRPLTLVVLPVTTLKME